MTKTFCDRCGKEIIKSKYGWLTHRTVCSTIRLCPSSPDVGVTRDGDAYICPDCEKSFERWFVKGENENG